MKSIFKQLQFDTTAMFGGFLVGNSIMLLALVATMSLLNLAGELISVIATALWGLSVPVFLCGIFAVLSPNGNQAESYPATFIGYFQVGAAAPFTTIRVIYLHSAGRFRRAS